MTLADDGFVRPVVDREGSRDDRSDVRRFRRTCPGVGVTAPVSSGPTRFDPVFGDYVAAWTAHAADPEVRAAGSSAGVLSAIQIHMIASTGSPVSCAGQDPVAPSRTAPLIASTRDDVMRNTGSRYAPVAALSVLAGDSARDQVAVVVGKPCEAVAYRQLADADGVPAGRRPLLLSFFCAGTPSQTATDRLVDGLGVAFVDVRSVRYRGDGWPGAFRVTRHDGSSAAMSYNESWGSHLGPTVQTRCKICVDGTGGHADIAVGDYWDADESGFPTFEEADGTSVVVARTERGAAVVRQLLDQGVLRGQSVDLATARQLQPLQTLRKTSLVARLAGRRLAGGRIPRYRRYRLLRTQAANASTFPRAFAGTFARTRISERQGRSSRERAD
ncbi:MAG: Coenzyme F420 hydrogenase/dehydrogenase, beta subunit C-terminal domain [Gordonia paraffinivorans]